MTVFSGLKFKIEYHRALHEWVLGGEVETYPNDNWEYQPIGGTRWKSYTPGGKPTFEPHLRYRWKPSKPRTVTIAGVELVAPEREAPAVGTNFYLSLLDGSLHSLKWIYSRKQAFLLDNGSVFLTPEAAAAMADVQRKQRLGEV